MKPDFSLLKNKQFVRNFFMLAIPLALQQLLILSVGLMDSLMVGSLGETSLSAVTLGNQPAYIMTLLIFGLSGGCGAMIAQYWGKGDTETIGKIMGFAIRTSLIAAFCFAAVVLTLPQQVMSLFTQDARTIALGSEYLRVVGFSYLFYGFSNVYLSCLRNVERVKIAVVVYSVSFCVNVFFNYMFIFGKFGAPEMGVAGAGVGTVLARVCEVAVLIFYALKIETRVRLRFSHIFKTEKWLKKDFLHYGLPVIFNEVTWGLGVTVQTAVFGHLGVAAVACVSIIANVQQVLTVMIYGTADAGLVLTGKLVGAKEYQKAQSAGDCFLLISVLLGIASGCMLIFARDFYLQLYSIAPQTYALAKEMIVVAGLAAMVQAVNITTIVGVLRGGGDTRFAMMLDMLFMWCLALPLGILSAFAFALPVPLVLLCLRSDEFVKIFIGVRRVLSRKWLRNITR